MSRNTRLAPGEIRFVNVPERPDVPVIESTLNGMSIEELQRRVKDGEANHVIVNSTQPRPPRGESGWVSPETVAPGESPFPPYEPAPSDESRPETIDEASSATTSSVEETPAVSGQHSGDEAPIVPDTAQAMLTVALHGKLGLVEHLARQSQREFAANNPGRTGDYFRSVQEALSDSRVNIDIGVSFTKEELKAAVEDARAIASAEKAQRREQRRAARQQATQQPVSGAAPKAQEATLSTPDAQQSTASTHHEDSEQPKVDKLVQLVRNLDVAALVTALTDEHISVGNGNDAEAVRVLREVLVRNNVFGDNTARDIGSLDDDEILALFQAVDYRSGTTAPAPVIPSTDLAAQGVPVESLSARTRVGSVRIDAAEQLVSDGKANEAARIIREQFKLMNLFPAVDVDSLTDDEVLALVDITPIQLPAPGTAAAPATPAHRGVPLPPPGTSAAPAVPPQSSTPPAQPTPQLPPPGTAAAPTIAVTSTPNQRTGTNPNLGPQTPDVLRQKQIALEDARTAWAKVSAKRHRRALTGWLVKRSNTYKNAQANYERLSREVAKLELSSSLASIEQDATLSAEEKLTQKRAAVDLHWIEEQNNLRDEATKNVEDRTWWKIVSGITKGMNSGSKKARFFKRAGIGMTLGLAAGLAGLATFGTGTAGAAALLITARFGHQQLSRVAGGIGKMSDQQASELKNERLGKRVQTDDQLLEYRASAFSKAYEKGSKEQTNKRLLSMGKSALWAGAGFGAGVAAHAAYDYVSGWTGGAGNHASTARSGPRIEGKQGIGGPTGLGNSGVEVSTPVGHDLLNPTAAYYVRPGEGWLETFRDMGIPQDKWADVLQDAGPKLRDLGVADFDAASNEWWISSSGNLSTNALQTIADSSAKFGYVFNKF